MKKLLRVAAVGVTALGFAVPGLAAAQTNVDHTGPGSSVVVRDDVSTDVRSDVRNRVRATVNNPQTAVTGNATAHNNTTAGGVESGMAANDSYNEMNATLHNSQAAAAEGLGNWAGSEADTNVNYTGPNSDVRVTRDATATYRSDVVNNLDLTVNNSQTAVSGHASATSNTTAGDVRTGDAENVSTNVFTVDITNE